MGITSMAREEVCTNPLEEMEINKTAKTHIIGICIETRPDALDDDWIKRFRYWGITRI